MENYYFNPEKLQFELVEPPRHRRTVNVLKFIVLVTVFSIFIFKLSEDIIQSPNFKKLQAQQESLVYEIELLNRDVTKYAEQLSRVEHNDDHLYRVFFEVDPIPVTKRKAGTGGVMRYRSLQNLPFSEMLTHAFMNLDQVSRQLVVQSKSFDEVIHLAETKEQRMAAKPSIQPISINELEHFGSAFGMRLHPILKKYRPHNGIDLTTPWGTNIYATADGTVIYASYSPGGYGNRIIIDHGFGYKTLYGHCSRFLVKRGQKVKRGEVIGKVGNTGLSTRSHLHYEVWVNNKPVNPINYYANDLSPQEYDRMIQLLANADPSFDIN
ncbi:MAG: M23 family metallopeptidase [Bacteroidales bacterium]|nr:M23 family metallopeptidase [Bacteroidales bacterium]